jgi:Flp pilus assembly protein TadG
VIARLRRWTFGTRPGNAYVEFGLICPLLVSTLGTIADFGLSIWARSRLSAAVSNASQYAAVAGPTVTSANVKSSVAQSVTPLTGVSVTITGPGCYCTSGTPVSMTSTTHCTTACASGNMPGTYVGIAATYTYSPLLPFYAAFANTALTETSIVRLQ